MSSQKVLVVDDSNTYLHFAASALEKAGYQVLTSDNAWISNLVSAEHPDLILMDVQLGAVSGVAAVGILRKRSFGKDICILLHSAAVPDELKAMAQSCGADGCLVKDGKPELLVNAVRQALSHQERRTAIH